MANRTIASTLMAVIAYSSASTAKTTATLLATASERLPVLIAQVAMIPRTAPMLAIARGLSAWFASPIKDDEAESLCI